MSQLARHRGPPPRMETLPHRPPRRRTKDLRGTALRATEAPRTASWLRLLIIKSLCHCACMQHVHPDLLDMTGPGKE